MTKTFADLLNNLPSEWMNRVHGGDAPVTAPVVESASSVEPGGVFVARRGASVDGHDFIPQAIERGAAAIVAERPLEAFDIPYAHITNPQLALGLLAAAYHDFPSRKLIVIGVTGTNGKTTTTTLLHRILQEATDGKTGYISTLAADLGGKTTDTGFHVTTPTAPEVQAYLAQMVANGLTHCVLEMTSHGLAQGRLQGVDTDVAVLTNITHEHLDYHGTFENYRAAKGRMFAMLSESYQKPGQPKISIVNADDPNADFFLGFDADTKRTFAIQAQADCRAAQIDYHPGMTQFSVRDERYQTALVGAFNVSNCLAAICTAQALKILPEHIQAGLAAVTAVSGRMERIDEGQDFIAMVDFAHTPDALEKALDAAREMVSPGGRLIAVFGSAGLRDVEKRRMMAEVSARMADFTVLTAEDPRTESLDTILQMMAEGCVSQGGVEGQTFTRVPDRGEAIYHACQMARAGDVVVACGKGHEQSMCFGTIEYPWDDRDALRAALRGKPLATLPTATTSTVD